MRKVKKKLASSIVALICTFILTSNLEAATLTVGSESGSPGDKSVLIPVELNSSPGEKVCSFNFDLSFDASRLSFREVTLGSVAVGANKSLSYSQPKSNIIRVIVIGFNQDVIENGTVLTFTFDILSNAPMGKAGLNITKPSISDPKGNLLSTNTDGGELGVFK